MKDLETLRISAHRRNISRYKRLLRTHLTELEREFVDRRLSEEKSALAQLIADRRSIPRSASDPISLGLANRDEEPPADFRRFGSSGVPWGVRRMRLEGGIGG
jgi:hypothetical protein